MNKKNTFLFLFCVLLFGTGFSTPSKYKLNETVLDKTMSLCEETDNVQNNGLYKTTFGKSKDGEIQTRSGYLLRAFFCGFIALHRSYMGTGGESMWWFYLCVPVAGQLDRAVDFWWVVFDDQALEKYRDNGKFFVWADNM